MQEREQQLYQIMLIRYHRWADFPRPEEYIGKSSSLMFDEDQLNKYGSFRNREWIDYVKARDEYLEECRFKP